MNKALYEKKWKENIYAVINGRKAIKDIRVGMRANRKSIYDIDNHKISWCNKTRKDPNSKTLLQVRCKESGCRKWFNPTKQQVKDRIRAIESMRGESNFYCSDDCKNNCSTFNKQIYPKGYEPNNMRHDQNDWAYMVKDRDKHTCQRCGDNKNLVAHHIEGLNLNPIESADIDIGITLCKKCNRLAHRKDGCKNHQLTKKYLCG